MKTIVAPLTYFVKLVNSEVERDIVDANYVNVYKHDKCDKKVCASVYLTHYHLEDRVTVHADLTPI